MLSRIEKLQSDRGIFRQGSGKRKQCISLQKGIKKFPLLGAVWKQKTNKIVLPSAPTPLSSM
jgi:hypothetical protein